MPLVKMRKTACGPDGVLMADSIHDMDAEIAKLFVDSESAVFCNADGTEKAVMSDGFERTETGAIKIQKRK